MRAYQRQGFAIEAVSCFLTYAFLTFDLHRIIAITDCENAASVALLERLRMRREGHFLQNVWFKGKWGMNICTPFSRRNGCSSKVQPYKAQIYASYPHKVQSKSPALLTLYFRGME